MVLEIKPFLLLLLSLYISASVVVGDNSTDEFSVESEDSRVLSRRKRFLTFPDGSSLQLVFCVQTAALIPIGDIFLYGNTAALAWNLPDDPAFTELFLNKDKAQRRGDVKNINYIDERGRVIARVPYKRQIIVNPAFAKRSVDEPQTFKEKLKVKIDRKKMHEKQTNREYLKKEHLDEKSIEFHRSNRLELLQKIEKLITALGRDGRQCVLYKLCEAAQHAVQGTFLQEFLRVIFTLPKGKEFDDIESREYDAAHTVAGDCVDRFPGCENFGMPVQI